MAIEVTDEMRQAVHEEDCARLGHDFALEDAFQSVPGGSPYPQLGARDSEAIPHLRCRRCARVFLIIEDGGNDYDDAAEKLKARLKNPKRLRVRHGDSPQVPQRAPDVTPGRYHAH